VEQRAGCGRKALDTVVDHRRFYVIGAATGEQGPYSLEELAEAARAGEVAGTDQVRTALGTRVGTVGSVLGGAAARPQAIGHESGGRRRTSPSTAIVLVILSLVVAIAGMVLALRPSESGDGKGRSEGRDLPAPAVSTATAAPDATAPAPVREPPPAPPSPAPPPALATAIYEPFAGISAHYALHRVRADYLGPLVRIHRDSDGREMDVGAQADGSLDGRAAAAFCGSSLGSVARWYDQGPAHADFCQPLPTGQPHIYDHGMLITCNRRPTMHFKRPDRWMDAAAKVGIGTMLVVLTCDEKERFAEFQTVLASAAQGDHAFLRGASGQPILDAMNHRVKTMHIDGALGVAFPPFAKLKVVDAELSQPAESETLRLGNDEGWVKLRGWNGAISEVVIFPQALPSDRLRAAEEALARHFSITLRN